MQMLLGYQELEMENLAKSYDSVEAGKLMLSLANQLGQNLNATKLQKLLFITYGYILAKKNYEIFTETPKAWPFGPVFPRVQKLVKLDNVIRPDDPGIRSIKEDSFLTEVMTDIVSKYARYSATQLSEWSHETGSPWYLTTQLPNFRWNDEIPNSYISEYFSQFNVR
ncbi:MAG: Panacea domain-containing protein [Dyadobacter fermentans]